MKILFAAGGTSGHINPAIAIAGRFKSAFPDAEFLFIGTENSLESRLVPAAGYPFKTMKVSGFSRSLSVKSLVHNIKTVGSLINAGRQAKQIIQEFSPDIAIGTGGYISGPIIRAAAKKGVKTLIHESNAYPGVTTKLLSKIVDVVLLATPKTKDYLPGAKRTEVVGTPVNPDFTNIIKQASRQKLGIAPDRFVVLSVGGSLGAVVFNRAVANAISWEVSQPEIVHIHGYGNRGSAFLPELEALGVDYKNNRNLDLREYISDMPVCMAAADLVVSRCGGSTITELCAAGKASILIPSPNVTENHQFHNGMTLVNAGAALMLEEKDITETALTELIKQFFFDRKKCEIFEKNALSLAVFDTTDRIFEISTELLKNR